MRTILVASSNLHKIQEIKQILEPRGILVRSVQEIGKLPEVVEDAETFEGNAVKKATEAARALGYTVLADDSGLEVDALNGAPGVYSARYAGPGGNDGRNLKKLLENLQGETNRQARFVCVLALASPDGLIGTAEGEVRGRIADAAYGNGGFGYDPAFIPEGYDKTFGELSAEVKNRLSHRSRALQNAIQKGLF